MTSDGKIYIVITDKLPTSDTKVVEKSSASGKGDGDGLYDYWAKSNLVNQMKSISSTLINYQLSNVGNFTGDYIKQNEINTSLSYVSLLSNVVKGAMSGAQWGGPVGAVYGAIMSVLNTGLTSALNIKSNIISVSKTNYEIEQLRNRAGLNALKDGSRGTEN